MGWPGAILTDSGGYQVFSLGDRRTVDDDGVQFRSHLDGSAHTLTPERAVDIQARLGSDIAMILDECPSWPVSEPDARAAMERTLRWARRGRQRFADVRSGRADVHVSNPGRCSSASCRGARSGASWGKRDRTVDIGFDAYAIGGLSVGEPVALMYDIVGSTAARLPTIGRAT